MAGVTPICTDENGRPRPVRSDDLLAAGSSVSVTTNEGEVALMEIALPPARKGGSSLSYYVENTNGIRLTADGTDVIHYPGLEFTTLECTTVGALITIDPLVDGEWAVSANFGPWTIGGSSLEASMFTRLDFESNLLDHFNTYDLSVTAGSPSYAAGKFGNAIAVGAGNNVGRSSHTEALDLDDPDATTLSLWIYFPSLAVDSAGFLGTGGFRFDTTSAGAVRIWSGGSNVGTANGIVTTGTWHHIVFRYAAGSPNICILWVDGVERVNSAQNEQGGTDFFTLGAGAGLNNANAGTRIDQLTLWSRKITDSEVLALYNGGLGYEFTTIVLRSTPTLQDVAAAGAVTDATVTVGGLTSTGGVQGTTLTSTIATGTAPLTVASTTMVANLNADTVDGVQASALQLISEKGAASGYASLSAGTLVVENPASASATPGNAVIPIADANGELAVGFVPGRVARWVKVTLGFADFAAAATVNDIEVFSLPAKGMIENVVIKHETAFSGGTLATYTVGLGIAGNFTKYSAILDVFQAPGDTVFQFNDIPGVESFGAATSIRARATSSGADLDQAAAGSVDFYILYSILP